MKSTHDIKHRAMLVAHADLMKAQAHQATCMLTLFDAKARLDQEGPEHALEPDYMQMLNNVVEAAEDDLTDAKAAVEKAQRAHKRAADDIGLDSALMTALGSLALLLSSVGTKNRRPGGLFGDMSDVGLGRLTDDLFKGRGPFFSNSAGGVDGEG